MYFHLHLSHIFSYFSFDFFFGPMKLSFRSKGEIKTFSDKQKLREFLPLDLLYKNILKSPLEKRKIIYIRNLDLHKDPQNSEG